LGERGTERLALTAKQVGVGSSTNEKGRGRVGQASGTIYRFGTVEI
jgi:hypothetical protein